MDRRANTLEAGNERRGLPVNGIHRLVPPDLIRVLPPLPHTRLGCARSNRKADRQRLELGLPAIGIRDIDVCAQRARRVAGFIVEVALVVLDIVDCAVGIRASVDRRHHRIAALAGRFGFECHFLQVLRENQGELRIAELLYALPAFPVGAQVVVEPGQRATAEVVLPALQARRMRRNAQALE